MRIADAWICLSFTFMLVSLSGAQTVPPQPPPITRATFVDASGASLDDLVRVALERNADLVATRQRTLEAQALLRQAGFRPNPVVETEFTSGAPTGSAGEREFSVGYAHTFELGGKRGRRVDVGAAGVDIAREEIRDRERAVRAEVQERYIAAMSAIRNFEAVAQQREVAEQSLEITRARVSEGESPRVDQMVLEADVGRLEAERLVLESEADQALVALRVVTGLEITDVLQLRPDGDRPPVTITVDAAVERGLAARPDLALFRSEEQRAAAEMALAQADRLPDFAAVVRYTDSRSRFDQFGTTSAGVLEPIRDRDRTLTGGISITLPLLNRNQGQIDAARARQVAARLRREYLARVVAAEIVAAHARHAAARRAVETFEQRVLGPSQESVDVLRASYAAGEVQLFAVVAEQRRLIDTQKAYTEAIRQEALARVALERAIGSPLP